MSNAEIEHRELTLMFTDIVGYSRLMGRDQPRTIAMLGDYRRILTEEIERQQGTIVEFIGDAVFARFDNPASAVTSAVNIQKALFAFNHFRDKQLPRLQTRIGLHCGSVAVRGSALFGDNVNIAARLEPIAVADAICVSEQVYKLVAHELLEPCLALGVQPLKNIDTKVSAYLIRPLGITLPIRGYYLNRKLQQKLGAYRYAIAVTLLVLVVAAIYLVPRWLVPGYDANYLEVANFQNLMSEQQGDDYLSAGITAAVRSQLADVNDVYVLNADEGIEAPVILQGSVQRVGKNLRIAYRLIRRDGMVQIVGGKLDGAFGDIFILQDRLVAEIAGHLADEFRLPNFRPAKIEITSDVMAYDYYMRGLGFLNSPTSHVNSDEAIKFFTTALVHDSAFAEAEAGLCQAYWKKYLKSNEPNWIERAEHHCLRALEIDSLLPKAIESMGIIYSEQGRYQEAEQLLEGVVAKNPDNMQAITALASIYATNDKFARAETLLTGAIKRQPKNWEGYHMLGWLYLRSGHLKQAVTTYQKVLDITPQNSTAFNNLGAAYFYLGEFGKAAGAYDEATRISPNAWGYSNTGYMHYYAGDYGKAIMEFRLAIRLSPDDFEYHMNLADALRQLGEHRKPAARWAIVEAEQEYKTAIQLALAGYHLNPKNPDVNISLAICYLFTGDDVNAKYHLDQALALRPNDSDFLHTKLRYQSRMQVVDGSIDTVEYMLKQGYSKQLISTDPDLSFLHSLSEFKYLLAQY
ncbi:tetratricopeptide repeat protein [Teredinibacter waterburyi]|jgi:Adenylate cyclase, family 3 (some proteins contain HAMP domain)|uniref:tetratricopeptide repeat protein n=1 Tax=Teredinibacter waterburyi TaxID=1500538 RepID=UPI001FEBE078|nr:tetratricopeptide repeat protein [Teredinibacter waterburyi]